MDITDSPIEGVFCIRARRFEDERGWFSELYQHERYGTLPGGFLPMQHNVSVSGAGVLRGMHFQHPSGQAKLVSVVHGRVCDVVVDVRVGSKTFGSWYGVELSQHDPLQLMIPSGCAHGFLVLDGPAIVHYACSAIYSPSADRTLAWNDPAVAILWPEVPRILSARDAAAPRLHILEQEGLLPRFGDEAAQRGDVD